MGQERSPPSHHTEPVFPPLLLRGSLLPFHLLAKPKERRLNYYALLYVFFLAVAVAVAEVCVGILQWRGEGGRCTMKVPVHKLKQLLLLSADCWELNEWVNEWINDNVKNIHWSLLRSSDLSSVLVIAASSRVVESDFPHRSSWIHSSLFLLLSLWSSVPFNRHFLAANKLWADRSTVTRCPNF